MSHDLLEFDRVSYWYPDAERPALNGVSVTIGAGELVVLAGRSGSGKSTLLRAASGLVPHFHGGVLAGRVSVAGMDTRDQTPARLATVVGTLLQDPETQVVMGTVRAELAFPLENRGEPHAAVARGVEEAALALGIAHLLDRSTAGLSGGELQRVALAAALAGRPSLVVLDEPTSQLDPVAGDELFALLRRINEDSDATIVVCEHRLERCLSTADRVIAMAAGAIVCDAPPEEFLGWASAAAPELATPGARLLRGLGLRPVAGVKAARAALRDGGLGVVDGAPEAAGPQPGAPDGAPEAASPQHGAPDTTTLRRPLGGRGPGGRETALRLDRVWHELAHGPAILRSASLAIRPCERVALMGRNGAGKSTLLRHAAGLMRPTRGRIHRAGRVALLLQNPTDYLVAETVAEEASPRALQAAGLTAFADRHPRDLSGGEKQRLALAIVLDDPGSPAAMVCLDEPTRGMDRRHKHELAQLLRRLNAAVLVATHDPEFVAAFADRVVLLADGAPIADGPTAEVLSGGTYFATETARILGGAGRALTPEQGIRLLRRAEVPV
jgi:energy-coupling factor transporter ATP-binding protein EcfA2